MRQLTIRLPRPDGRMEICRLHDDPIRLDRQEHPFNRVAFSAAHVVADPHATPEPALRVAIDWEATLAYRRRLADLGLGIAEAMDTAQRGMGLSWTQALDLIRATTSELRGHPSARVFSGVGTDHVDPLSVRGLDDVVGAYREQLDAVQALGGRVILMASRALARSAQTANDYVSVYRRVLAEADQPLILHWLGDMFDPTLAGYWGASDFETALATVLEIINENAAKIDGIKISLLDADKEIRLRRALPIGVRMYTGDDFNYPNLISGDDLGYSDALLGIFDAIAPAASVALAALANGDEARFAELLAPTVPLSRTIFRAPTYATRRGSCSSPGSTGSKSISPCSVALRRFDRSTIFPTFFEKPTRRGCSPSQKWPSSG